LINELKKTKMAKKYVIHSKNLPTKLPVWQTLTTWLALERGNAPEWLWGAAGLLFLTVWAVSIYGLIKEERIDVFEEEEEDK
jgi:hypothetical protein